jgi:hypothetical protein
MAAMRLSEMEEQWSRAKAVGEEVKRLKIKEASIGREKSVFRRGIREV